MTDRLRLLALAFLAGTAAPALAADPAPTLAEDPAPEVANAAQADGGQPTADADTSDQEIVVTGEKVDRSLQDTLTSVRVFTSEDIERGNLIDLFDALERTANVTSTFQKSGFTIRGIANDNVTGVGTGDLATIYLDGSPLPRTALNGPLDLWDVAQVEVLRGPQSTLQGRNALAGAVIIHTADPTYEWTGRGRIILTDEDEERRFGLALGGPIVDGQLAFRVAGEHGRADGLITNVTRDDDRAGFHDGDNIRGKLLFTPTALPGLRVVASYLHDRHSNGVSYSFDDTPDAWRHRITAGNRPTIDRTKTDLWTLDASYDLGHALTLSSVTTYARVRPSTVYDGDDTAEDSAYGSFSQDQRTLTQELRLSLASGPVTGLIGAYYSHLDNKHDLSNSVFSLSPVDDLGLPAEIAGIYPDRLYIDTSQFYPQTVRTLAVFGDGAWQVAPRLTLRAGFRYDDERQVRANNNIVSLVTPLPNPEDFGDFADTIAFVNALIAEQVAAANASSPPARTSFGAFLPKAGITYDFNPDASLSFTVQRGYRSGGSGVNPGRGELYTYQPEYTWNYELALRTEWLDHRLSLNANAFYIDWKQQQVNVQLSGNIYDYQTINAGSSRVWGFELESRFRASRALSAYASLGYANTRFKDFISTVGTLADYSGREFPSAPRLTLAAGATWQSPRGWFANLNASYRSSAFSRIDPQDLRDLRRHLIANARIGWQNDHVGAFLTATNIFNTHYFDYSYLNGDHQESLFGEPRILGVTLEGRF